MLLTGTTGESRAGHAAAVSPARLPAVTKRHSRITAPVILPPHARGMRIGLFGGTFDPPHAAHRAACLLAMRRLGLDRVWWLVTPGNPLKDTRGLAPLTERIAAAQALQDRICQLLAASRPS